MSTQHEEIAAKMSLDTGPVARALRGIQSQLKSFGSAVTTQFAAIGGTVAAMFSIKSLVGFGQSLFSMADELQNASERLSITASLLQDLRIAAKATGLEFGQLEAGLEKLFRKIGDARSGNTAAITDFEKLGVKLQDTHGQAKPFEEILKSVVSHIAAIPDEATRAAASFDAFGKAGAKMVPFLSQANENFKKLSETIGKVSDKDVAKVDRLGDAIGLLYIKLKSLALTKLASFLPDFKDAEKALGVTGKVPTDKGRNPRDLEGEKKFGDFGRQLAQRDGAIRSAEAKLTGAITDRVAFSLEELANSKLNFRGGLGKDQATAREIVKRQALAEQLRGAGRFDESLAQFGKADELRRTLSSNVRSTDREVFEAQTKALQDSKVAMQELLRKASEEGLVIIPRNGK